MTENKAFEIAKLMILLYDDIEPFSSTLEEKLDTMIDTFKNLQNSTYMIETFLFLASERKEFAENDAEEIVKQYDKILTAIFNEFSTETKDFIYKAREIGHVFFEYDEDAYEIDLPF